MKENVVFVDFSKKRKYKNKEHAVQHNSIIDKIKRFFSFSNNNSKSKIVNANYKRIL